VQVWSLAVTRVQLSLSGMKTSNCMCNSLRPMKSPYLCIGTKNVCAQQCKIPALKTDLTHHFNSLLFLSLVLCAKAAGSPIYSCRRTRSGRFCICRESGFLIPQHRCQTYFLIFFLVEIVFCLSVRQRIKYDVAMEKFWALKGFVGVEYLWRKRIKNLSAMHWRHHPTSHVVLWCLSTPGAGVLRYVDA
jgi:hypothetical protein